jgi:hypothetical protein
VEVFVLVDLLDDYDFSVGWGYDNLVGLLTEETNRTLEEVHHKCVDNDAYEKYNIERNAALEPEEEGCVEQQQYDETCS